MQSLISAGVINQMAANQLDDYLTQNAPYELKRLVTVQYHPLTNRVTWGLTQVHNLEWCHKGFESKTSKKQAPKAGGCAS